jgi:hypothetical protein
MIQHSQSLSAVWVATHAIWFVDSDYSRHSFIGVGERGKNLPFLQGGALSPERKATLQIGAQQRAWCGSGAPPFAAEMGLLRLPWPG